jgi:hypothetical protein
LAIPLLLASVELAAPRSAWRRGSFNDEALMTCDPWQLAWMLLALKLQVGRIVNPRGA